MNELKIFENRRFGKVRVHQKYQDISFCLADVCKILEIGNVTDVKNRLKQDGVVSIEVIDNLGRTQQATFINESNLYKVIFQSRKAEAEQFTDWVTSEVLPSIRKNGGYIANQNQLTSEELMAQAILVAQKVIAEKDQQLEAQRPKVLFADSVAVSKTSVLVGELAKILKQNGHEIGQNRFFDWLRKNGYLVSRQGTDFNMPTQRSMELGLFEIKETTIQHADGHVSISKTPKVTGKGQVYFVNKFNVKECI
jgi:anti-repressor protein